MRELLEPSAAPEWVYPNGLKLPLSEASVIMSAYDDGGKKSVHVIGDGRGEFPSEPRDAALVKRQVWFVRILCQGVIAHE